MELPSETQQLCDDYLYFVRINPTHELKAIQRFSIYKSLGEGKLFRSSFLDNPSLSKANTTADWYKSLIKLIHNELLEATIADITFAWIGILTVRKVLPLWAIVEPNNNFDNVFHPLDVLEIVEGVLQRKIDVSDAHLKLHDDFYYGLNVTNSTDFRVICIFLAAYSVLESLLADSVTLINTFSVENDGNEGVYRDFASLSLKAYTVIPNKECENYHLGDPDIILEFGLQKRLEFWEEWLANTIPNAWNLAHQTFSYLPKF